MSWEIRGEQFQRQPLAPQEAFLLLEMEQVSATGYSQAALTEQ
jgi:hypothetical protein